MRENKSRGKQRKGKRKQRKTNKKRRRKSQVKPSTFGNKYNQYQIGERIYINNK